MHRKGTIMKIAVTYDNGKVFGHFGHTENFKLYDTEDGKIKAMVVVPTNGSGHGALAGFLKEHGVEVLICGGADDAVRALLSGKLRFDPFIKCSHHHEEGHNCGNHSCSDHKCGEK